MSSPALSSGSQQLSASSSFQELSTVESALQDESQDGQQEEGEEDGVVVARPPRSAAASAEVALSGQAALDALDQLLASGQVGRERASRLRRKYLLLKETLENSRAVESSLLTQAKQLGQHLTQQQRVLEKGARFPDGDTSEPTRLRQLLLQHQNQLEQSQQRLAKLQAQVDRLEEEKEQVNREYNRLPQKEEMEERIQSKTRQLEELRDELKMRSRDTQRYKEDMESRNYKLSTIQQETEELKQMENALQDELIQIRTAPGNLPREIDTLRKRKGDTRQTMGECDTHLQDLDVQISELERRKEEVRAERLKVVRQLKERRGEGGRLGEQLEQVERTLAEAKEREVALLENRASLELQLRHRMAEHHTLFELLASHTRERDREAKQLKKVELQLTAAEQAELQVRRKHDQIQSKVGEGKRVLEERGKKREDLTVEVEQLRRGLNTQEGLTSSHQAAVDGKLKEEEQVRNRVSKMSAKLQDLNKDIVAKTHMRDRESRSCYQARCAELNTMANLQTQGAQLREERKQLQQLEQQLREFAEAYQLVKTERNHTYTQIHNMQQLAAEMREKWRILQNEAEILRSSADDKERLLQKCSLVQSAKALERDTQRQELSHLQLAQAETRASLEEQREVLSKLTQEVTTLEQHLNQLQRHYEQALQERNDAGLQLIERNEEVCVFHEKLNMQEAVLRQANLDLMAREEELRYLRMEISQLQNSILVGRKSLPEKNKLEGELDMAQIELKQCEEELRRLEREVEDAGEPSRLRLLGGEEPLQDNLRTKVEQLEEQMMKQEQHQLERELLHEQVCKLTDRAQSKVEGHKDSTLQVAQRVNYYQNKIKEITRKTMALVSELTMKQAVALRLQQEVQQRETAVERAYSKLQAGEPPDEATAQQWTHMLRDEERRKEALIRKKLEEEEEESEITTAEPRPVAYIPDGEGELPIPKPYGQHAPFKPTQPGANMRHIRKPEPKPIDI